VVSQLEGLLGGLEIPEVDNSISPSRDEHATAVGEPCTGDPVGVTEQRLDELLRGGLYLRSEYIEDLYGFIV